MNTPRSAGSAQGFSHARCLLAVVSVALVAACGAGEPSRSSIRASEDLTTTTLPELATPGGDRSELPAAWEPAADAPPDATAHSFVALVTRLGCSGGSTGEVFDPTVVADADQVVVTFTVANSGAPGRCIGNDRVAVTVHLDEPLGDRRLIDGSCLEDATDTSHCLGGPVRWEP